MDVTQKTVTANKMLNGATALKNDGTDVEGNIPTKTSSNLTVSGATVTAPAGYYESDASKSVASMSLPTTAASSATSGYTSKATIGRSTSDQYINIPTGYNASGAYYKVSAVANGSAQTPATGITANPTINVDTSTGLITSTASATKSVTPTVSAGYVSAGIAGTVTVSGSNTQQLTVQAGKTVTPTESEQTAVAANRYTTGAVKVGAISPNYIGSGVTQNDSDDLTVNGPTVTAPAGNYASAASKTIPDAEYEAHNSFTFRTQNSQRKCDIEAWSTIEVPGYVEGGTIVAMDESYNAVAANTTITPSASSQTVGGANWIMEGALTVAAMPTGTVTAPASISGTAATVTTGTDTLTLTKTVSVTPSVTTAGYVSSGTAGNSSVSLTASVNTRSSSDLTNSVGSDNKLTVTAPAGYYSANAAKTIQAASVTVGLNKGTASNHQITVSATKGLSSGYLNSTSQITTDSVSVSASELVSGNLEITENGENIDVSNYSTVTVNVPSSGINGRLYQDSDGYIHLEEEASGSSAGIDAPIRFFDYDGTLIAGYEEVPEALPDVPIHSALKDGAWNYTLPEITAQFNAMGTCDIGANYTTVSGATEIDVEIDDPALLSTYIRFALNGKASIDWGDNSTVYVYTKDNISSVTNYSHTYEHTGSYTIRILPEADPTEYAMSGVNTKPLMHCNNSTSSYYNFANASCVKAVRIGPNCILLGNAFRELSCVATISLPSNYAIGNYSTLFYGCRSLKFLAVPRGTTLLANNFLTDSNLLSAISIPASVTSIGYGALWNLFNLRRISIPYSVTSIGESGFNSARSVSDFAIPSGVTSLGASVFASCTGITEIDLSDTSASIGANAFQYCYALRSAKLPTGLTSIPASCFAACRTLESVDIPNTVTSIGSLAFDSCVSMASVTIPSSVTTINSEAFKNCYGIREYHIQASSPRTALVNTNAFTGILGTCVIYVPKSENQAVLNAYKADTNWSTYADNMQEEPE